MNQVKLNRRKLQLNAQVVALCAAVFACFTPLTSLGQPFGEVKIEENVVITVNDGLPSNHCRSVVETPDGFIWISTGKGLARFDGAEVKTFTHEPEDPTSIFDNRISPILLDSQSLWLGTHLGLSRMDLRTETFQNYQFAQGRFIDTLDKRIPTRVMSLEKSSSGDIWLGTFDDGLFRYLPELDSFKSYRFPQEKVAPYYPTKKSIDHVMSLRQDRFNDSIMWAGTTAGLLKVNTFTDEIQWFLYPKSDEKQFTHQNAIRSIYQHEDSLLYLTSWYAGVNIFNPQTAHFYPLPFKNQKPGERERAVRFLSTPIAPVVKKNETEIWITTFFGMMTYHIPSQTWKRIQENDIKQNIIYGVRFIDSKNRAWYPRANGLHFYNPLLQQFVQHNYEHLNSDLIGYTYYFLFQENENAFGVLPHSGQGIYYFNPDSNSWRMFKVPEKYREAKGNFEPRGYALSPSKQFWTISTPSGLYNFFPKSSVFKPLNVPLWLRDKVFRTVLWDKLGRLWLGLTNDGLARWTPESNQWEWYVSELKGGNPQIEIGNITDLFEDSQGNIWINRQGGYSVYESQQDSFHNFLQGINLDPKIKTIFEFAEDQHGRVWINSLNALLSYSQAQNPHKGVVEIYDLQEMYALPRLIFLRADAHGMLWAFYGRVIYQIDPSTMKLTAHSMKYGISEQDPLYGFNILPDGKLLFGGENKIWLADPQNFKSNTENPVPYLTDISILQKPLVDTAAHLITQLNLAHDENFFSLGFSSIGFTRGNDNKFLYRLKNFDNKWIPAENRRFANFTNVPSGDFIFELQAANNEGIWNEDIFRLPIHIATPWWETVWFLSFMTSLIVGIGYLAYQWRIRQVRREERLRSEYEFKLTDMEMSALRAQMNPHFIFNAMNSIEYFIINNEPEKASDYLNRFSRLIRLILQNSKSTIVPLKDDLEALKLYIEIESTRFDGLFDYEVKIQKDLDMEKIMVPPMLIQPYVENAIWHGLMQKKDGQGKIDLTLRRDNGTLICLIEDNGIGREAAEKLKSKSTTRKKSFGMKITHDRLDALNQLAGTKASVQIFDLKDQDENATGTRVELIIPL